MRPSTAEKAAIAKLEAAGFVVGPDYLHPEMIGVRRTENSAARVWLDIGDTVGLLGDKSDADYSLFLDVVEALDGPEARARVKAERASPFD